MKNNALPELISFEVLSGTLLIAMLLVALVFANTALRHVYDGVVDLPVQLGVGHLIIKKPLLLWVNEGLMAIFFMLLALEIKREVWVGELSNLKQLVLPVAGAIGGILLPILIYIVLNHHNAQHMRGWPIATTTDIAFALSIIAMLGKRVPPSLRAMLVALSIVDDILAVMIIAMTSRHELSFWSLGLSAVCVGILILFNWLGIKRLAPYLLIGVVIWALVLRSGIHATLAGVAVGLTVPFENNRENVSPLMHLEHSLQPWVAFGILPLFVFMNGGISFLNFSWHELLNPIVLGIGLGLCVGKTAGGFLISSLLIKLKMAHMPRAANFRQLLGLCSLTGIGFTMSLFLAALAFSNTAYETYAQHGVLFGSLVACLLGVGLMGGSKLENLEHSEE